MEFSKPGICMELAVLAKEEQGQHTGTGMGTDDSTNVVDVNVLCTVLFF